MALLVAAGLQDCGGLAGRNGQLMLPASTAFKREQAFERRQLRASRAGALACRRC